MSAPIDRTALHSPRRTASAALALALVISGVVHAGILVGAHMIKIDVPEPVAWEEDDGPTLTLDLRTTSVFADVPEEGADEPAPPAPEEPAPGVEEPAVLEVAQIPEAVIVPPEELVPPQPEPPPIVEAPPPDRPVEEPLPQPVETPPEPVVQTSEPVADPVPTTPGVTGDTPSKDAPTQPANGSGTDPTAPVPASQPAQPASGPKAPTGQTAGGTGLGGAARDDGLALRTKSSPRPTYPEAARRRGEQGSVTCQLTIARDGRVLEVIVVTSSGYASLDEAAVRALKKWRFESLERLTTKDRAYARQRLTFELSDAKSKG